MSLNQYDLFRASLPERLASYKIKTKSGSSSFFVPNRAQANFLANSWSRNIILKGRQLGFTTLKSIQALDHVLHTPNANAMMIAQTADVATDIFDGKISFAWENLPKDLRDLYKIDADSAKTLKFGFGGADYSKIHVGASARGGTFDFMHITEMAYLDKYFPNKAKELFEGAESAVPRDGRLDIESTANGSSGRFYDLWQEYYGKEQRSPKDFRCHFYGWWWDDESIRAIREEEYLEIPDAIQKYLNTVWDGRLGTKQRQFWYANFRSKGWESMFREYPSTPEEAFSSSVSGFYEVNERPAEFVLQGGARIFGEYEPQNKYAIGADVALGKGGDHSAFVVWDMTNAKVVATYAENMIAPEDFAGKIAEWARKYGNCVVGVENNSIGVATILRLADIYPKGLIYKETTGVQDLRERASTHYGWSTNAKTKAMMHDELRTAIIAGAKLQDARIIKEASSYGSEELGKTNDTRHYDLLTATAIGWQMRKMKREIMYW